ncbi:MAG: hypothetical protein ACK5NN_08530, partial [Sphingomonadaceae bacterium]
PPDPGSQLIMAIPLILLFEGSLLMMWVGERKKADNEEENTPESDEAIAGEDTEASQAADSQAIETGGN